MGDHGAIVSATTDERAQAPPQRSSKYLKEPRQRLENPSSAPSRALAISEESRRTILPSG